VATNLNGGELPKSDRPTDLERDWASIAAPKNLLLKFPGTAGRAERSSPFPANLIARRTGAGESETAAASSDHDETWTWNPPGYGGSSGRANLQTLMPAAESFASRILARRLGEQTRVWICGNSLGCLPALSLASRFEDWLPDRTPGDRVALWLRNPPDLAEVVLRIADRYAARFWMRRVVSKLPPTLDAIDSASRCWIPAVFLMSDRDTLVPPVLQRRVHDAYAGDHHLVTLTGLGHAGAIEERHRSDVENAVDWLVGL